MQVTSAVEAGSKQAKKAEERAQAKSGARAGAPTPPLTQHSLPACTSLAANDACSQLCTPRSSRTTAHAPGLDAVLQDMAGGARKVTVLDKSRQDWSGFKVRAVPRERVLVVCTSVDNLDGVMCITRRAPSLNDSFGCLHTQRLPKGRVPSTPPSSPSQPPTTCAHTTTHTRVQDTNTEVDEELEEHKRSGGQYLDKVGFLQRAELREYEKERDQRLAADMRGRGRL